MRKIKIESWKAPIPVRDSEGKIIGKEDGEENLLTAFNVLIGNKRPEDMPRGLDKFRLFNRISKAFTKAEKSGYLMLEEIDYKFLKDTVEKDIPSAWGFNEDLTKAIEDFLTAPEE